MAWEIGGADVGVLVRGDEVALGKEGEGALELDSFHGGKGYGYWGELGAFQEGFL